MAPDMEVTFYACASKQSHHEVVTEKSVSAVCFRVRFKLTANVKAATTLLELSQSRMKVQPIFV